MFLASQHVVVLALVTSVFPAVLASRAHVIAFVSVHATIVACHMDNLPRRASLAKMDPLFGPLETAVYSEKHANP